MANSESQLNLLWLIKKTVSFFKDLLDFERYHISYVPIGVTIKKALKISTLYYNNLR